MSKEQCLVLRSEWCRIRNLIRWGVFLGIFQVVIVVFFVIICSAGMRSIREGVTGEIFPFSNKTPVSKFF